jgi:hypothetical protein
MRKFNVLAALTAALLMGVGASAGEKSDETKPRKICRTEQMPGRITPKRVCRIAPPSDAAGRNDQRKGAEPRERASDRD